MGDMSSIHPDRRGPDKTFWFQLAALLGLYLIPGLTILAIY